jgi:hypothetical protein
VRGNRDQIAYLLQRQARFLELSLLQLLLHLLYQPFPLLLVMSEDEIVAVIEE